MAWDEEGFDSFNAEFTAETGIKVNRAVFPQGVWSDVMNKLRALEPDRLFGL